MKSLVIAEKPSVGRDIARVLHCTTGINGGLEGKDYIVTWGLGHLVTLADPEGYDEKYKAWNMEDLPMITGGDQADGQTVPGGENPASQERCERSHHCHGCRAGRRAGGQVDPRKGR